MGTRVALEAGQLGSERLRGSHDDVGAHVAERRRRDVRLQAGHGGALVDGHPQALHDVRETAGETGRVDGGAVRRVAGAEAPGHLDALAHLGGAEHPVVLLAEAPLALVLDRLAQAQQLHRRERQVQLAAEVEARVDALVLHHACDLVHRPVQRALLVDHRLPSVCLGCVASVIPGTWCGTSRRCVRRRRTRRSRAPAPRCAGVGLPS